MKIGINRGYLLPMNIEEITGRLLANLKVNKGDGEALDIMKVLINQNNIQHK